MSAITIDIRDEVTPALAALRESCQPQNVNPAIGTAVKKLFQNHFIGLPSNKQGFPTTNFWADAARSTTWMLLADGVLIRVDKAGVQQRLRGGDIVPGAGKTYLTLPATADAYGHRAGEFNLKFAIVNQDGFQRPALVARRSVAAMVTQTKTGKFKHTGDEIGEVVFYWLVRHVHQEPNPDVIPSDDEITTAATDTVQDIVARALYHNGGAA